MNNEKKPIPIGVDDFKELRENNYYFIDKSLLISEILKTGSKVVLFTRPRRFGETLNMSMLHHYLDYNAPSSVPLFKGLKINTEENGKYLDHMNKYLKNLFFQA